MLYPTAQDWADWGISDECHQFFCLHWTELFDPETPDTWQVRTCNVRTMLREVIEAAKVAEERDAYRGVLRSLLDEVFAVVARDIILERSFPFVLQYLEPWREKEVGEKDIQGIERLARVILGNLDGYRDRGVELVLGLLREANKKKKKDLYSGAMNLAIETVSRGRSLQHTRTVFRSTVLTPSKTPFLQRVQDVFTEYGKGPTKYTCLFLTEGIRHKEASTLPSDITIQLGRPATVRPGPEAQFFKRTPNVGVCLKVEVRAADPEVAKHLADKRLGEVFSGLNLFSIDDRIGAKQLDVLVEDEAGTPTLVPHQRLGSQYLGSYEAKLAKAELLFRVLQRVGEGDAAQLSAAMQYHRLALLASSDEARLVNLWIALEALCQGGEGSIIKRVWTRIAPCVSLENVRKTLVSLSIYVRNLWTSADQVEFLRLFPHSTRERLEPEDLSDLLLLPETHEKIATLCQLTARHPLILHRLWRVKTMMLNVPKSLAENLRVTCQNVEWQLKRIYRVRNAIVHQGRASGMLPQLTQHLHCYLIKAIYSILTDLDQQPAWSIGDSLEHRRRLFDHLVAFYSTTSGEKIAAAAIMNPQHCMAPQTAPFAWPAPPDPSAESPTAPSSPSGS